MQATFSQCQIASLVKLAPSFTDANSLFFSGSDAGPSQLCLQWQAESSKEGMISSRSRLWGCEGERMKYEIFILQEEHPRGAAVSYLPCYPPTPHGKEAQSESYTPALYSKQFIQISLMRKSAKTGGSLVKKGTVVHQQC